MADSLRRARNAARRLLAGLPLRDAPPSPDVPNQVFRALTSIYLFAAGRVDGRAVLDWGCGTGFGSALLAEGGARSVTGVDPDAAAIRYARRRFGGGTVGFGVRPLDAPLDPAEGAEPGVPAAPYGRLVAVGTLARLSDPEEAVGRAVAGLPADGGMIASLPPILDGPTLELHRGRHPEAARFFLWDWSDLLGRCFGELRVFSHQAPAGARLDLASPHPSDLDESAFRFEEIPLDDLDNIGTLGAVFVGTAPRC